MAAVEDEEVAQGAGEAWQGNYSRGCRMSIGWVSSSEYPKDTMEELYRRADIAMYQDKAVYYDQNQYRKER